MPADYDGDGRTDIAVFRSATGEWHILLSSTNFTAFVSYQWGVSTDVAVLADYDGDRKADVAVYRPATGVWYILLSSTNSTTYVNYQWGVNTDVAVPADYDGDRQGRHRGVSAGQRATGASCSRRTNGVRPTSATSRPYEHRRRRCRPTTTAIARPTNRGVSPCHGRMDPAVRHQLRDLRELPMGGQGRHLPCQPTTTATAEAMSRSFVVRRASGTSCYRARTLRPTPATSGARAPTSPC